MGRYRWRQRLPSFAVLPILHYCNRRLLRHRRQFCRAAAAFSQAAYSGSRISTLYVAVAVIRSAKKNAKTPTLLRSYWVYSTLHWEALQNIAACRVFTRKQQEKPLFLTAAESLTTTIQYYILLHSTTQYTTQSSIRRKASTFCSNGELQRQTWLAFPNKSQLERQKGQKRLEKGLESQAFFSVSTTTFSSTFLQVSLLAILYPPICYYQKGQIDSFLSREEFLTNSVKSLLYNRYRLDRQYCLHCKYVQFLNVSHFPL